MRGREHWFHMCLVHRMVESYSVKVWLSAHSCSQCLGQVRGPVYMRAPKSSLPGFVNPTLMERAWLGSRLDPPVKDLVHTVRACAEFSIGFLYTN